MAKSSTASRSAQWVNSVRVEGIGGVDLAEILDLIDSAQLPEIVNSVKQKKLDVQAMINDPDLATFRTEFLQTLQGIHSLVLSESEIEVDLTEYSSVDGLVVPARAGPRSCKVSVSR
mgnify:CR=1 FL=1|jgi:hypothetical protein